MTFEICDTGDYYVVDFITIDKIEELENAALEAIKDYLGDGIELVSFEESEPLKFANSTAPIYTMTVKYNVDNLEVYFDIVEVEI